MRNVSRVALAVLVFAALVLGPGTPQASATTNDYLDDTGEWSIEDRRGDIDWVAATYSDGVVGLALSTVVQDNLSSPNWVNGAVSLSWEIATPTGTYDAWFFGHNWGEVTNSNFEEVCQFSPDQLDGGAYFAAFPASCIGSPSSFKVQGWISYDDEWGTGSSSFDFAPSSHFCCEVLPSSGSTTTTTTTQPSTTTTTTTTTTTQPDPVVERAAAGGYWMVREDGVVHNFGGAQHYGNAALPPGARAVDIEPVGEGGYYVLDQQGKVYGFRDASLAGDVKYMLAPDEEAVSLSVMPNRFGYWIFTSKGRVFAKGEAPFLGDMSGTVLNGEVLDSVATPSGQGYWMVAADGGIFSFGDAKFYGSMGGTKLNEPVMSMAPDPDGVGYWLVASDGGIFAFQADFHGSMGGTKLNKPVSGIVPGSDGYLMVAEDGGIFAFGNVAFHGSLGANPPPSPVVSVALLD